MKPFDPKSGPKAASLYAQLQKQRACIQAFLDQDLSAYELEVWAIKMACLAYFVYDAEAPVDHEYIAAWGRVTAEEMKLYTIYRSTQAEVEYLNNKKPEETKELLIKFIQGLSVNKPSDKK